MMLWLIDGVRFESGMACLPEGLSKETQNKYW